MKMMLFGVFLLSFVRSGLASLPTQQQSDACSDQVNTLSLFLVQIADEVMTTSRLPHIDTFRRAAKEIQQTLLLCQNVNLDPTRLANCAEYIHPLYFEASLLFVAYQQNDKVYFAKMLLKLSVQAVNAVVACKQALTPLNPQPSLPDL